MTDKDLISRANAINALDKEEGLYSDKTIAFHNGVMAALFHAKEAIAALPAVTPTPEPATVAAIWRANGGPDPHGNRYDCERAALSKGNLTDDELANAIFMADRNSLDLIVWQTAAKDRIRWLSRALERAVTPPQEPATNGVFVPMETLERWFHGADEFSRECDEWLRLRREDLPEAKGLQFGGTERRHKIAVDMFLEIGQVANLFEPPLATSQSSDPVTNAGSCQPTIADVLKVPEVAALKRDAERYRYLRGRDLDTIHEGGVFAGMTPDNIVLNFDTLDDAIDAALRNLGDAQ